jgi:5-methylcytosine-specific restriction endonuclease McrA
MAEPGQTSCSKHLRKRQAPKVPGAYGKEYTDAREILIARWSSNPDTRCWICSLPAQAGDPWEPDHIRPVAEGGGAHVTNLQPAHRSCNRRRGAQLAAALRKQAAEEAAQRRITETYRYLESARGN